MSTHLLLKHLHVAFVVISIVGFFLRGVWMLSDSPLLDRAGCGWCRT
jgi:uncharacterized membrane protein SirB2